MTSLDQSPQFGVRQLIAAAPAAEQTPLRATFGMFATGITVVTAGSTVPCGMTANSFTSVSLDPPLILVCIGRGATIHNTIIDAEAFAVSVLGAHQNDAARHFANRRRPRGEQEFDAVDSVPGPRTGVPILSDSLAWLECELAAVYDGGDHSIFLGSVLNSGRRASGDALLYFGGGYHTLERQTAER